jgi:hypothetical protein
MNNEQLQELINWLSKQIVHTNNAITEANQSHNFGREAQFEGMRDAFVRCLKKVSTERVR